MKLKYFETPTTFHFSWASNVVDMFNGCFRGPHVSYSLPVYTCFSQGVSRYQIWRGGDWWHSMGRFPICIGVSLRWTMWRPASVNVLGAASRPGWGQEDHVTLGFDFLFKRSDLIISTEFVPLSKGWTMNAWWGIWSRSNCSHSKWKWKCWFQVHFSLSWFDALKVFVGERLVLCCSYCVTRAAFDTFPAFIRSIPDIKWRYSKRLIMRSSPYC